MLFKSPYAHAFNASFNNGSQREAQAVPFLDCLRRHVSWMLCVHLVSAGKKCTVTYFHLAERIARQSASLAFKRARNWRRYIFINLHVVSFLHWPHNPHVLKRQHLKRGPRARERRWAFWVAVFKSRQNTLIANRSHIPIYLTTFHPKVIKLLPKTPNGSPNKPPRRLSTWAPNAKNATICYLTSYPITFYASA